MHLLKDFLPSLIAVNEVKFIKLIGLKELQGQLDKLTFSMRESWGGDVFLL